MTTLTIADEIWHIDGFAEKTAVLVGRRHQ